MTITALPTRPAQPPAPARPVMTGHPPGGQAHQPAMTGDTLIRHLAAGVVLPLSVDGLILAASLVMLHQARHHKPAPTLARCMLTLGVTATVTANIAYGSRYGPLGAAISACQPSPHRLRRNGHPHGPHHPHHDQPATSHPSQTATSTRTTSTKAAALAILASHHNVTGSEPGRAIGASERTGRRILAHLATQDQRQKPGGR